MSKKTKLAKAALYIAGPTLAALAATYFVTNSKEIGDLVATVAKDNLLKPVFQDPIARGFYYAIRYGVQWGSYPVGGLSAKWIYDNVKKLARNIN
jgi:hypothetical protein